MSNEYVPEVSDIREKYVYSRGNDGCRENDSRTEFDRMIAKVRFDAYNEGAEATHISGDLFDVDEAQANNPYK